jgi:YVTN family beta-propeller protein
LFILLTVALLWTGALAAQLRQVAIIDLPGRPGFDTVAFAGKYVLIAHNGAGTVDVFDPARRRVAAQIKGLQQPRGIALDEDSGTVYVADTGNNTIVVISLSGFKVERSIQLQYAPDQLLFVPGDNTLYITNAYAQSLTALHPNAAGQAQTVGLEGRPDHLLWDPQQHVIYCSVQDRNEVLVLDPSLRIARRYALKASQPTGLALDAKARRLFVAVRYAVLVLDSDNGSEVGRIPTAAGTDALWYDSGTNSVYAAMTGGTVSMIREQNGRWSSEQELLTQVRGHTLAFDPSRQLVYMPGGREGRSKLVILKRVENTPQTAGSSASLR